MNQSYPSAPMTVTLLLRLFALAFILSLPIVFLEIAHWKLSANMTFKTVYLSAVTILTNIAGIFYARRRIKKQASFQLFNEARTNTYQFLPYVIIGALALFFLIDPLEKVLPFPERYQRFFTALLSMKGYSFLVIVLLLPILEEMLFRGIILNGFLKNYAPLKAIFLSSLFFGLIHFNIAQAVSAFLTGLFLGYLYWQTRSLSICILAHVLYNAIFYFGFHFLEVGFSIESAITNTTIYLAIYFVAALALTVAILMIYKKSEQLQ